MSAKTFIENAWKGRDDRHDGIVTQLIKEGKVNRYRTQYQGHFILKEAKRW